MKEAEKHISILLAEDDPNLGSFLQIYLSGKGYATKLYRDGQSAYEAFMKGGFNFVITDIMMPVKDGFSLAKDIRKKNERVPILFLTAKTLEADRLEGFQTGGDDYLTKPFSMDELLLRIRAIVRRTIDRPKEDKELYSLGGVVFDVLEQRLVDDSGKETPLTCKEAELLKVFCLNENEVVERKDILVHVWGADNYFNARSMDVYIAKLRKVLKEVCTAEIINVHGVGYKLVVS